MTIQVSCPACSKSYQVKDAAAGKKFQCKGCETVVVVPDAESTSGDSSRSRSTTGESPKRKSASSSATSGGKRKSSTRPQSSPDTRKRSATAKKKRRSSEQDSSASRRRSKGSKSAAASSSYDEYEEYEYDDAGQAEYEEYDYSDQDYEDYGDYGENDYEDSYSSPSSAASKRSSKSKSKSGGKKKKKSSSSGGGFAVGFNLNRLNAALCVIGVMGLFIGFQEARLSARSNDTPTQMTLAELVQNGPGNNIYLTLTEITYLVDETVVYGTETAGGDISNYDKVWTPMQPSGFAGDGGVKAVLHSTNARTDAAVGNLLQRASHTGMIINDIESFSGDERSLIQSGLRGSSIEDVYIFQEGRTPSGAGIVMLYFLGGSALILGGLAWIFLVQ